jgi:hypothetical protein
MSENCPYTATCPFYRNWLDYRGERRRDVIVASGSQKVNISHDCLTLIALEDTESGITIGASLWTVLLNPGEIRMVDCSLNSLNGEGYLEGIASSLTGLPK